jgi:hypothetical protein
MLLTVAVLVGLPVAEVSTISTKSLPEGATVVYELIIAII